MLPAKKNYLTDILLIKDTAKQIIKDFRLYNLDITFSGKPETAYDELFDQIFPVIDELISLDYGKFQSLLYQIDVGENQVSKIMEDNPKSLYSKEITKLILEREFQKVLTKHYFQKNKLKSKSRD